MKLDLDRTGVPIVPRVVMFEEEQVSYKVWWWTRAVLSTKMVGDQLRSGVSREEHT